MGGGSTSNYPSFGDMHIGVIGLGDNVKFHTGVPRGIIVVDPGKQAIL